MSFISYAQNFEDVMLWRALKHVKNGFYVDIGAQHPVIDSVSKAFYEHGWRGVHIEPVPHYAQLLRQDRPDETVLEIAISDIEGKLDLNLIPDTGLSTAVDAYADLHHNERGFNSQRLQVPVLTLRSALHFVGDQEVHWLKVDVEGLETQVLKGWDSTTLRPWIMVVEATIPNSYKTDYASWDPILISANYQFVYFDGLNRFYVAKEHIELVESFSCPPNVFDGVRLSGLASSELCQGLLAKENELLTKIAQFEENLNSVLNSRSWRMTAPIRYIEHKIRLISTGEISRPTLIMPRRLKSRLSQMRNTVVNAFSVNFFKSCISSLLHRIRSMLANQVWHLAKPLIWVMRRILANPQLKAIVINFFARYPKLKQRLRQLAIRLGWGVASTVNTPKVRKRQNMSVVERLGEEELRLSLMRATKAWPLGKRKNG